MLFPWYSHLSLYNIYYPSDKYISLDIIGSQVKDKDSNSSLVRPFLSINDWQNYRGSDQASISPKAYDLVYYKNQFIRTLIRQ